MPVRAWVSLIVLLTLPSSTLAVWTGTGWEKWWDSKTAPIEWAGPLPVLMNSLHWRTVATGVEWSEARIAGRGEAWRIRLIVTRIDPQAVRFQLDTAFRSRGTRAGWSITRAPANALVAVNAGQFPYSLPWGWVVMNGREFLPPKPAPLSVGIAFDSSGAVRWLNPETLKAPWIGRGISAAFQSYPRLLADGVVPLPLQEEDRGVDLAHRDARAAFGETSEGLILIVLTRFDGAGGVLDFVPFGLTVPEMAAVMGGLGARNAVLLDGGISSQLLIRDHPVRRWRGLRPVPLGLIATSRH